MEKLPSASIIDRNLQLKKIADPATLWDVLVIGGGATGLGVALDAVARGYKTLLVEGSDFAKGTSSRSTKLVHGGVRYLAQGDVRLVREASIERGRLCRNAPHLVKNQTFIIPIYSHWDKLKYTVGLKLYDWIRVVVDVQLLEPSDDVVLDLLQAPHALADEDGFSRSRDQNALHDRFETQVELDRRTLRDTKDLDA